MATKLVLKTCSTCFKQNYDVRECSRCKAVAYCSKKCQTNDWQAGHKKECKKLAIQNKKCTREVSCQKFSTNVFCVVLHTRLTNRSEQ